MKTRTLRIILVLLIPLSMFAARAWGEDAADANDAAAPSVRIYLPRTRTVDKAALTLDDVAIVSGRDDALAAKVRAVQLGRAPFAGERITINRQTVLAQLASAELPVAQLRVIGSQETVVHRKATDVSTEDILAAATAYMKANVPPGVTSWQLATQPQEISLPAEKGAQLRCQYVDDSPSGQVHVRVILTNETKVLASRLVVFRVKYQARQLLAVADIARGETITPANTRLETVEVTQPPEDVYVPPYGKQARVLITTGSQINDTHVHEPKPKVVIQRNQTVRMRIQGDGWCITALGTALQNGHVGETIRVRNLDSRRVIAGQIDEHGYVVPLTPGSEVAAREDMQR